MAKSFSSWLDDLLAGQSMSLEQAHDAMRTLARGDWTDVQVAGFLVALRAKGATADELAGMALVMREMAEPVHLDIPNLVDTCGTGGGIPSFNLSTAAAFVAAGAGAKVAKHGNRAVTSKCGSSDVLEALGLDLKIEPSRLPAIAEKIGLVFLFAPNHHPAFARLGPVRRELGVRTIMNQLGPLANPAKAPRQLIGVYDPKMLMPMTEALGKIGCVRGIVAHAEIGLDEISPCGPTQIAIWNEGRAALRTVTPEDFGLQPIPVEALAPGADAAENAAILKEALTDPKSPRAMAILPNAAAVLWCGGVVEKLGEGAALALEAIRSGTAWAKLEALIEEQRGA